MKLLATGDLHLGAGSSLGREPGARLLDQNAVLDKILSTACAHEVEAILVAGDVFEGPVVTPEQMDAFAWFVDGARIAGIPVVAISGNGVHDASMRSVNGLAIFDRLPGIDVYSRPALHDLGPVQVACLPWVSPARLIANMDGDVDRDRVNARAAGLLVQVASGIADPNVKPTVLMLHGSLSGASLPTGIPTDELREPVIDVESLVDLGFHLVVASHIHVPQAYERSGLGWTKDIHRERPHADVIYTGSPMPLNFGETGVPHGVWILEIDAGVSTTEFVPIESRPLTQATLDLAALDPAFTHDPLDFYESVLHPGAWTDVDEAIVKVTLRCTDSQRRRLDLARLRAAVLDAGAHTVKIDVDTVREQRTRVNGVTGEIEPLAAFDAWVAANETGDTVLLAAAREQMQDDLEKVAA